MRFKPGFYLSLSDFLLVLGWRDFGIWIGMFKIRVGHGEEGHAGDAFPGQGKDGIGGIKRKNKKQKII